MVKASLNDLCALQCATQRCPPGQSCPLMMARVSAYSCLALLQMQQNVCTLKCICGHKLAYKELTWGSAGSTFSASTGFVRAIASCSEGQMLSIIAIVCNRPSRHDQLRPDSSDMTEPLALRRCRLSLHGEAVMVFQMHFVSEGQRSQERL